MRYLGLLLGCLVLASATYATTIYNNGGPRNEYILIADQGFPVFLADDFTLQAGSNTITSIHWWGGYAYHPRPTRDDFTIAIYEQQDGAPALHPIFETEVNSYTRTLSSPPDRYNNDIFHYSTFISPLELTAGATYYLSITNNTHILGSTWSWSDACYNCSNNFVRTDPNAPWRMDNSLVRLAFYLTNDPGPIPEPGTCCLLLMGLAGWTLRSRR